jgi:hypothetical protein
VQTLLESADDRFVIMGPGDEIAMRFLPVGEPPQGYTRRYLLYLNAFYMGTSNSMNVPMDVEPMPFQAMSNFPYPLGEHYPVDQFHVDYQYVYNTRIVQ